jgi:hypothetical protein
MARLWAARAGAEPSGAVFRIDQVAAEASAESHADGMLRATGTSAVERACVAITPVAHDADKSFPQLVAETGNSPNPSALQRKRTLRPVARRHLGSCRMGSAKLPDATAEACWSCRLLSA